MGFRSQWKTLYLLYTLPPAPEEGLSYKELAAAGIDCGPDTLQPLISIGALALSGNRYTLSPTALGFLNFFLITNRRWGSKDVWVDYPKAFVIMPFSESWSAPVYNQLIKPSIEGAGLECIRGDATVRIGDLAQNIWNEILQAGVIIADVSALNSNVFYEIGLAHAIGKEVFILKQKQVKIPADFGGSHYYEYDLNDLSGMKAILQNALAAFATEHHFENVKAMLSP